MAGAVLAGVLLVFFATPANAQEGAQATVVVGGPVANCPPATPSDSKPFAGTVNGIQLSGAGQCTPTSARSDGFYTIPGSSTQGFASRCAVQDGTVVTQGGVYVPEGTIVNGVAQPGGTLITAENQPVTFPNGQTAILNQVIVGPTSTTRNAIAFDDGPIVGQVICGPAVYPLAVEPDTVFGAPPLAPSSAGGDDGPVSSLVLLGGGLALVVVLAQIAVTRRIRRNET